MTNLELERFFRWLRAEREAGRGREAEAVLRFVWRSREFGN